MVSGAVFSTLAGGINGTIGVYADASGTNAGFNYPEGVAVDVSGNVFVADTSNQRIRMVTVEGGTRFRPVALRALAVRMLTFKHCQCVKGLGHHKLKAFFSIVPVNV